MTPSRLFRTAFKHFRQRTRRAWISRSRAHIEYRELGAEEFESFREALERAASRLDCLQWIEVNPYTRRVIFAFEDGAYALDELIPFVAEAERSAGFEGVGFAEDLYEHPADIEPGERLLLELGADAVGFVIGLGLKLSPFGPSKIASSTASVLAIVRSTGKLRKVVDDRYGAHRADLAMSMVSGIAQGFAQRPISSLVEITQKGALLREAHARRAVWRRRESELAGKRSPFTRDDAGLEPRPCPLPRGPIEEYADRAWVVSLGGFAVSFLTTRSVQRAFGALFGGLPKPARLGRDVFASALGRELAKRDVLILDPEALRRLDRVDCLVLQGDLVARGRFKLGRVIVQADITEEEVRRRVQALYEPEEPVSIRRRDGFALGPVSLLEGQRDETLMEHAEQLSQEGNLVLGLSHDLRLIALVEVQVIPRTGIDELIAAAHEATMRVVVASNDESVLQGLPADDTIPDGDGLRRGIRRLQREGRVVCLVATGQSSGLPLADVGIGLMRSGQATPWGADIICEDDLSDVRFVIAACTMARQVAKQSVNIALGAATVGALVSAGGLLPMTARRVFAVVNTASLLSMANGARSSLSLSRRALPTPRDPTPYHALNAKGVLNRLGSAEQGLSLREVAAREPQTERRKSAMVELGSAITDELFSPLAPLLAAGAGLSAVVGSLGDAAMVGGVVVLNALFGGVQRFRTERKIDDLSRTSRRRAVVRRGGRLQEVDAGALVRGDIVLLGPGDVVPADCRIIETERLEVDASSLTGESMPVPKDALPSYEAQVADRSSMLYEGTSIASGQATAVVVAIGEETEARRGAAASKRVPLQSGVERRLRDLIDLTGPVALGAGVGLVGTGLLRGRRLEDLVGSGVSLAVASVPEGLPLLATAAQLAAANRLSKRGALVRNVRSIEALGRVDVLCVDKTGTVTQGRIDLSSVSDGFEEQPLRELSGPRLRVLAAGLRATPDTTTATAQVDPTDAALCRAAARLAVRTDYACAAWSRQSELPFEAGRGFHAVLGNTDGGPRLSVKGAPEVILPMCTRFGANDEPVHLDDLERQRLSSVAGELARRGLRVLAVAERSVDPDDRLDPTRLVGLTFHGLLAFSDPVRPTAAAAVRRLREAGVSTVMITGDHPSTAEAIASELDLANGWGVMSGAELSTLSDEELDGCINKVAVFARVTPSQKVRVVRAFQRSGRIVAMVGDGANDAPAIRLANVGIAIGEQSTSAARSAADVVLTDERIETLVHAIVEGRAMWASVRDAVSILIGGNLGEIGFTLAAGLIDGRPPLSARQLLLVNLLTDVAPAMAIALRPPSAETLESLANEGPDASLGQPLNREIASRALTTAFGAGLAWSTARFMGSRERANTVALLALVGTQLGQTMTSGGFSRPVVTTSVASSLALAAIIQTPVLSRLFGCRALGPVGWATAVGASALATTAGLHAPRLVEEFATKWRLKDIPFVREPLSLANRAAELLRPAEASNGDAGPEDPGYDSEPA